MQNRLIVFILSTTFSLQSSASENPSMHPVPSPNDPARERFGANAIGWIWMKRGGGDCWGVTVGVAPVEPGKEANCTTTSGGTNPVEEEGCLGNSH